jgi:hypothetical protein
LFLVDATVGQNAVASSASVASSSTSDFALAPVSALSDFDVVAASLKAKLYNFGSSLIDNTQPQLSVAVSSLSLLPSKALTVRGSKSLPARFQHRKPTTLGENFLAQDFNKSLLKKTKF